MIDRIKNQTVSVIIPCHNYARFLGECLQSVIGQTHTPLEIIVIDDDSSDRPEDVVSRFNSENLQIVHVCNRNIAKTQNFGVQISKGEFICCIDADDTIHPFYIEDALSKIKEDYRIGIVYSDLEYRGLMNGKSNFPTSSLDADIYRSNFIHSGSLFRKNIALLTDSFEHKIDDKYLVDWCVWRKILKDGYWAVKQQSPYIYRRHEDSTTLSRSWTYYEAAALKHQHISLVILVDEMQYAWKEQEKFLLEQNWPKELISLLVICQSNNEATEDLRNSVLELPYEDVQFLTIDISTNLKLREKEIDLARKIAEEIDSPYFLYVDEFVVPKNDVIQKLMEPLCENTVSVCSDFSKESWNIVYLKKRNGRKVRATQGIHNTESNTFSCVLIRSNPFKKIFTESNSEDLDSYMLSPEHYFYSNVRGEYVSKINCNTVSSLSYDENKIESMINEMAESFDEDYYLSKNPDVRLAIDQGLYLSGFEHYKKFGAIEGREHRIIESIFDESYYLKNNPDVLSAVRSGQFTSGHEHYMLHGEKEGRRAFFY